MGLLRGKSGSADGAGQESTVDAPEAEPSARGQTPGKGRPTPTRRERQAGRRGPVPPPPRTQRESLRRQRRTRKERRASTAARRESNAVRRERMKAGDERYLMGRDRGPDKAHVRDLVDARRTVMSMFMPLALFILVSIFIPSPALKQLAGYVTTAIFLIMLVEGTWLGVLVNRRVRERFPDTTNSRLGLAFYAFSRATQPRRLRVPKPRVQPGATV